MKKSELKQLIKESLKETINNEEDYTYHDDEDAPKWLIDAITKIGFKLYKETGIILGQINIHAVGLNKDNTPRFTHITYSGGDKRNLNLDRSWINEVIPSAGDEPKKNIDKISDVIIQLRRIQQLMFKTKPKQAEIVGQAIKVLEKAQSTL